MVMGKPITPREPRQSIYGIDPNLVTRRGADLPGIVSLKMEDLFSDSPKVIFPGENGLAAVRRNTITSMEKVDLGKIKPSHSVNILASHHGFTLLGGEPYAEMLKAIKDIVQERTGCANIRLRAGVGLRFRETEEYIKRFHLDEYYSYRGKSRAEGVAPVDQGIAIETEIGTLYGIKKVYDADWIIHAHNSDVREIHFHRQVDRAVKPFGMSYARIETRSTYHFNIGPRAANFVARAIFDSPFVQEKFVCSVFMMMSPSGVVGVEADNDLYRLNDKVNLGGMKYYGKMITLLGEIDECVAMLDFPCPVPYVFAAGIIYANFCGANQDLFDLDKPLPSYTWYTESLYNRKDVPLIEGVPKLNPAIKMCVHNYAWTGYPSEFFAKHIPTIVVGREQADFFNKDSQNPNYMQHALISDDLDAAMHFVKSATRCDKLIIFDGAVGGINVSESLAKLFIERAPVVDQKVSRELMPQWMEQRKISREVLKQIA